MENNRIVIRQAIENDMANKKYNPMNDVLFKFIFGGSSLFSVGIV